MENNIEKSLGKALKSYAEVKNTDAGQLLNKLKNAFDAELDFMAKVDKLDEAFNDMPDFEALREVAFDLLMINFFAEDTKKLDEDYLDSPEWEKIEEQTLDRGTELLNVLLYLGECKDEDIEPGLDDFLKEFLLVDEDEFQDEHHIYEDIIANQSLVESDYKAIAQTAKSIDKESEMAELFYPVMGFFLDNNPDDDQYKAFLSAAQNPAFDAAVYQLLLTYNQ